MKKRLTRTGNSLALVLDRPLLEAARIGPKTELEVSTDGDVIVVTPVRGTARRRRFHAAIEEINEEYAGVFKRLAE
jgi:antitoxin component of MazEF toxin-antitoxin module